jgi:hypothetical protein
MIIFNPLSMDARSDTSLAPKFTQTTKKAANSVDFGVKYYFCGRLEIDMYSIRQPNEQIF